MAVNEAGFAASFTDPAVLESVRDELERLRGVTRVRVYSPCLLPHRHSDRAQHQSEHHETLREWIRRRRVEIGGTAGGIAGLLGGYILQYYPSVISYPLNVGGRPLQSVPAFLQVTFEMMVLFSAFGTVGALFLCLRLPKLHQDVFDIDWIAEQAQQDRFVLYVQGTAGGWDEDAVRKCLSSGGQGEVKAV